MNNQSEPRLRIALLTSLIAPYSAVGGISELYKTLAEGLGMAGHLVTVIGVDIHEATYSTQGWGAIVSLPRRKKIKFVPRPFQEAFAVAREMRRRRGSFDVVECSSWPGLTALLMSRRLASVVRLITSIAVDSHVERKEMLINYTLEWLAVRRATLVFASTDYIISKSRELYRLKLPNVAKVSLAVSDVAQADLNRGANATIRILVIAAATKRKGTDVLLRSLGITLKHTDAFEITLIGAAWATYDSFAAGSEELASLWAEVRSKLGSRLELRYNVSEEEKMRLLTQTDYLLMTSRSESFGLPVIEAMRSGVAVISSRGGALSEVSGASEQNLFYDDPEDHEALSQLLLRAIEAGPNDAMLRRQSSRRAYERFYQSHVLIEKTVAGYRRAIASKAGRKSSTKYTVD